MHFCYIIYSTNIDRFYVGESEDVPLRVQQHNNGFFKNSYTSKVSDWELKLVLSCLNRGHARKVEAFIKRMKSRKFIEKLIADTHLPHKIIERYS